MTDPLTRLDELDSRFNGPPPKHLLEDALQRAERSHAEKLERARRNVEVHWADAKYRGRWVLNAYRARATARYPDEWWGAYYAWRAARDHCQPALSALRSCRAEYHRLLAEAPTMAEAAE